MMNRIFELLKQNIFHLKTITFAIKKLQKEKTLSCPIQDSEDCMSIIELLVLYNFLFIRLSLQHILKN